jgi:hypothetical protein
MILNKVFYKNYELKKRRAYGRINREEEGFEGKKPS